MAHSVPLGSAVDGILVLGAALACDAERAPHRSTRNANRSIGQLPTAYGSNIDPHHDTP